ncbi:MAG: RES family NAD+ phosphorylase [Cyanobacteria bacterium J06621_8]
MHIDPHPPPPEDFHQLNLPISLEKDKVYYRLNNRNYRGAIYFDRSGSGRFDASTQSYGICYTGEDLEAAFIECFGRELGVRFLSQEFIKTRNIFLIESSRELKLVDLFGSGLTKLGVDSRLSSGDDYSTARKWAEAIYNHPVQVDGIRYYSRHDNSRLCCGLFDRTRKALTETNQGSLLDNPQKLAEILNHYSFGLG